MTAPRTEIVTSQRAARLGESLLVVDDLHVDFPTEAGVAHAVRGLSFGLRPGRTLAIAGESGSGKSATSLALMGLLPGNASVRGSVRLDGQELLGLDDRRMSRIRGAQLAMVFQDPLSALTPVHTAGRQIEEALRSHQDLTPRLARRRAMELLDLVGVRSPEQRLESYPHTLSGGMRQRVMIAIAIANQPRVLIADEPTTALDVTVQAQVLEALQVAQRETGAALLLITHDLGVVARMADDVTVMYAGRAVESGPVDQVLLTPKMPYTKGLLASVPSIEVRSGGLRPIPGTPPLPQDTIVGCAFAARCPFVEARCRALEPALLPVAPDGGHSAACLRTQALDATDWHDGAEHQAEPPESTIGSEAVLRVDRLSHSYSLSSRYLRRASGQIRAVDSVSFEVRRGETLALVGESGCGKSTILHQVMRLAAPQEGTIAVLGQDVKALGADGRRRARGLVQMVFQDPLGALDPRMQVRQILAEPLEARGWSRTSARRRVTELVELVGLSQQALNKFPAHFSGGQCQRISLARALATEPSLIVLDEPVSALDVSVQASILSLLEDVQRRTGVAYLFVTHDLSVVRQVAHRVAVMYLGRLVEVGDTGDVFDSPRHPYTRALLSAVPVPDPVVEKRRQRIVLRGDLAGAAAGEAGPGCAFAPRCPVYEHLADESRATCDTRRPSLSSDAHTTVAHACHFPDISAAKEQESTQ